MSIGQIFVINLQRRPERLSHFLDECTRESVPLRCIKVSPAVDAQTHVFTSDEMRMFSASDLDANSETGKGCMANQLSHLQILHEIVKQRISFSIIFQDDVKLGQNFWEQVQVVTNEMRERAIPIVWIGLHQVGAGSYFEDLDLQNQPAFEELYTNHVHSHLAFLQPHINPASLAYVISLEGARAYLKHVQTEGIHFATDINYRKYLLDRNQFVGATPMLCTGNSRFKSDIFCFDDHAIMRDLLEILGDD